MRNTGKTQTNWSMTITVMIDIYEIEDEYAYDPDIFTEDEPEISKLKWIIWNKLDMTERRIILVYAHLGNIRDTAKVFKVSPTTIWNTITNIRKKICQYGSTRQERDKEK